MKPEARSAPASRRTTSSKSLATFSRYRVIPRFARRSSHMGGTSRTGWPSMPRTAPAMPPASSFFFDSRM